MNSTNTLNKFFTLTIKLSKYIEQEKADFAADVQKYRTGSSNAKRNIAIKFLEFRISLIVNNSPFEALGILTQCQDIMKGEGMNGIVKGMCSKTIFNGETILIIGSLLDKTGKLLNRSKKAARFYDYREK